MLAHTLTAGFSTNGLLTVDGCKHVDHQAANNYTVVERKGVWPKPFSAQLPSVAETFFFDVLGDEAPLPGTTGGVSVQVLLLTQRAPGLEP